MVKMQQGSLQYLGYCTLGYGGIGVLVSWAGWYWSVGVLGDEGIGVSRYSTMMLENSGHVVFGLLGHWGIGLLGYGAGGNIGIPPKEENSVLQTA